MENKEKKIEDFYDGKSSEVSNIRDDFSIFSAHPYPKNRQLPESRSVYSENVDRAVGNSRGSAFAAEVIKVNPNIDIKALFKDD